VAGDLDGAQEEARRAVQLARDGAATSEAYVLLGRIASARRQREQALLAFRNAVRAEAALAASGGTPEAEPWQLLAAEYLEAGDEAAAVRTLDDLAAHVPGDGSAFRELGRALLERREPARAERHLLRAVALDASDVEAHRLLAEVHEALRRHPEAREDLLAVLRAEPDDAAALLALGRMALRQGDLDQAREWLHRHVRSAPDRAEAHLRVVFLWLEGSHGEAALAAARAAIEDVGPEPRLRFAEGIALQVLRRWEESARALGAVGADAGELFVSARVAQADALSRVRRHAAAERALQALLVAAPDDVRLVTMRATVLERAGRAVEAVALLRRAVAGRQRGALEADLPDLYAALGESLVAAGRPAEAVVTLRDAVAARPRDETLLYALGSAHERAGQSEAAVAQMRALLSVNPDHAEALNFIGYTFAEQGVRLEEAERLVRRALELKPRSGHVLDSLGWVLYRRGDFRRAIEALEEADRLSGPDATILEHLGDAYLAAARHADAARAYRRALASFADEHPQEAGRRASLEKKLRETATSAKRSRGR
jgi:tetratricopeptide (TPR) repeat protein